MAEELEQLAARAVPELEDLLEQRLAEVDNGDGLNSDGLSAVEASAHGWSTSGHGARG
jgi:hypothetical protein